MCVVSDTASDSLSVESHFSRGKTGKIERESRAEMTKNREPFESVLQENLMSQATFL